MGKHGTEYPRIGRDFYPTPHEPVKDLSRYLDLRGLIGWEHACGDSRMAQSLLILGCARVFTSDIVDYGNKQDAVFDFLSAGEPERLPRCNLLATNPPFGKSGRTAVAFIEAGLRRLPIGGTLALLLPCDFDSGKTRTHLFRDCPHFVGKIVLTQRVVWFLRNDGKKEAPRENSAWFIWQRNPLLTPRPPVLLYAPHQNGD
jgi:hypothetical protein